MILTDREIAVAMRTGQIIIDPPPDAAALSSTSIDLTLAKSGIVYTETAGLTIKPGEPGFRYDNISPLQKDVDIATYDIPPQSFLLAWTAEYIDLPEQSRLAARVEGKSSLARLGVGVHVTAPLIHAGFKGQIQLEIFNFGPNTLCLQPCMRICQLVFETTLGTPDKGYRGMFYDQASPG